MSWTLGGIYLPLMVAVSNDTHTHTHTNSLIHSCFSASYPSGVKIKEQLQAIPRMIDLKRSQCDGDPLLGERRKPGEGRRRKEERKLIEESQDKNKKSQNQKNFIVHHKQGRTGTNIQPWYCSHTSPHYNASTPTHYLNLCSEGEKI